MKFSCLIYRTLLKLVSYTYMVTHDTFLSKCKYTQIPRHKNNPATK